MAVPSGVQAASFARGGNPGVDVSPFCSEMICGVNAPCPWTSIMPTGGVDITEASLTEWFKSGIVCAGIGSKLITKSMIEKKDYAGITRNVRQVIDIIARLKSASAATR